MDNENIKNAETPEEKQQRKKGDPRLYMILTQIAVVIVFIGIAFGIKIYGGSIYKTIKEIFIDYYSEKTDVKQVTSSGDNLDADYIFDFDDIREKLSQNNTVNLIWPVNGKITSEYGYRNHPSNGKYSLHGGIDISAKMNTVVACAADGIVEKSGESKSFGNYVLIKHGENLETLYAHLSSSNVKSGDKIRQGEIIALSGNSGDSTGPHLHFEVRVCSMRINPRCLLSENNEA